MQKQTINTSLRSTPTLCVPANFTALHLAHISWNLYCESAPTYYANEFSICDSSDFAHYNIQDSVDKAQHFFDCAFAIGSAVVDNPDYSVQEAYDMLDEFYGDTVVREDVSSSVANAVTQFVQSADYSKYTDYIAADYAALQQDAAAAVCSHIAKLEKQLATLKAQVSA